MLAARRCLRLCWGGSVANSCNRGALVHTCRATQVLQPGDIAVDATCGNGNDSLALAQLIGPTGCLYAVDLQAAAVDATKIKLDTIPKIAMPKVVFHQGCHSGLRELVGIGTAKLVVFNLGFLPRGDKAMTTQQDTTIAAVKAALEVVCEGGVVSIMAYTSHPGGEEEYMAVRELVAALSPHNWVCSELCHLNRPAAPSLILVCRVTVKEAA